MRVRANISTCSRRWPLTSLLVVLGVVLPLCLLAASPAAMVTIDSSGAQPRQVEDTTVTAVQRDYGRAWHMLETAIEENQAALLDSAFTGVAREKLSQAIADQQKNGLKRRYVDHGHQVRVVFYSIDGSAIQVQDAANLEIQMLDGNKVVHSEHTTVRYLALLTPAENSWKVRVIESVPGF